MAVINEDAFKARIKSESLAPIYIIFGDDGYLKKMYVEKLTKMTADKDDVFNYHRFGADCDLQEVYDAVSQLPMMADKKCVILCDYDFERCSKADFDKLLSLAVEGIDTSLLIIWFDSLEIDPKKSSKFKKLVSAAEKCGGAAVGLNHRRAPVLVKMLTDGAAKRGCKMDSAAARYLVESAGEDINTLVNELEKLCCYLPNGEITKATVDYVCTKTPEASVYNLSKQIFARQSGEALKTLDELFFMRFEPMMILYAVSSPYVDMYRLYALKKGGADKKELSELFGYKGREFLIDRAAQNLRLFDFKRLSLSFSALLDADRQLKSFGASERIILEQLVIRLIYIIAKGEAVDKA